MRSTARIDVGVESLRGEIRTVLESINGLAGEMRRTSDSIRSEHAADRQVIHVTLRDHLVRIRALESSSSPGPNTPQE